MRIATLVLPECARFAGEALPPGIAKWLGRADRLTGQGGVEPLFDILPRGWPAAAATRQAERGDAVGAAWVRADPAYVQPDINGARLLGIGRMLVLDSESTDALLQTLRPLFGDMGMPIEATTPSRWYLRLAAGTPLPMFTDPGDALGADFFEHLPEGPVGRRWRALLSEAQVALHHHPLNESRAAQGLPPVNSVWFWGGGQLPDHVSALVDRIYSDDEVVAAFARLARIDHLTRPAAWPRADDRVAIDLRDQRRLDRLCTDWIEPALADIAGRRLDVLSLQFHDGARFDVTRSQVVRFWKRPLHFLAPATDA